VSAIEKKSFGGGEVETAHGIRIERDDSRGDTVWVTDMKSGRLVKFSLDGKKIAEFGSHGTGKGQFLAPADIAFHDMVAYTSDGDSGKNNRVTAWRLDTRGMPASMLWQTPSEFKSPHSICFHEQTQKLVLANRFAQNLHLLDPGTGKDLGVLQCEALDLRESRPYGVRMIGTNLVVVSNDGKKGHQFIHIVEFPSGETCGGLVQKIPIDAKTCATPHLLGIDHDTEDIYVACLAGGGVKRLSKARHGSGTILV